jgi:ubiquinone/menaquinone biosynthesis C-methylase UbiE
VNRGNVDAKQHIAEVFDRAARSYDQVGVDFFGPVARELVRHARIKPTDDVLDVGCGRGAVLQEAAERARTVTGIDLAPGMVELAGREAPKNATVLKGDAEEPEFPDASFDVVTANMVIFFLPDPGKALRNCRRLLRAGGRVVFSTFGAEDERYTKAVEALAAFTGRPRHERSPVFSTPSTIKALLENNGFRGHTQERAFESRLRDPEHWLEWLWSHSSRTILERVPEDRMDDEKKAAFAEIEKARAPEGDLVFTTRIRFTTGMV